MKEQQSRIYYFDIMKAFAILAVVITHVAGSSWYHIVDMENVAANGFDKAGFVVSSIWLGLAKCGVPIFLMTSGALLLQKSYSIKQIYKRIGLLAVSLVIMLMTYEITVSLCDAESSQLSVINVLRNTMTDLLLGTGPTYSWYLYTLIGIYIILPILKVYVDAVNEQIYRYTLLIIWIVSSVIPFVMLIIPADISMSVQMLLMGTNTFSGFVGYFLLGYYLEKYDLRVPESMLAILGVLGIGIATYLVVMNPGTMEDYMRYYMPGVVIYGVAMYVLIRRLAQRLQDTKIYGVLSDLGTKTLGIYMLHMPVVMVLDKYIDLNNYCTVNLIWEVPAFSFAVLIITYIIVCIMRLIPGVQRVV